MPVATIRERGASLPTVNCTGHVTLSVFTSPRKGSKIPETAEQTAPSVPSSAKGTDKGEEATSQEKGST